MFTWDWVGASMIHVGEVVEALAEGILHVHVVCMLVQTTI